jgi:hypothetical protein
MNSRNISPGPYPGGKIEKSNDAYLYLFPALRQKSNPTFMGKRSKYYLPMEEF